MCACSGFKKSELDYFYISLIYSINKGLFKGIDIKWVNYDYFKDPLCYSFIKFFILSYSSYFILYNSFSFYSLFMLQSGSSSTFFQPPAE